MPSNIISAVNDVPYSYILVVGGISAFIESAAAQIYKKNGSAP